MDGPTRGFPSGDMRVSDADRDRAVSELSVAYQAGRLTAEEFDQRSGQALHARTGKELIALFADLPRNAVPAPRATDLERGARRVLAARVAMGVSAAAAISLAALAAANALSADTVTAPAKRMLAREILAGRGISIQFPSQPTAGFDWAGTITPALIAVLFIAAIIVLRVTRADRA